MPRKFVDGAESPTWSSYLDLGCSCDGDSYFFSAQSVPREVRQPPSLTFCDCFGMRTSSSKGKEGIERTCSFLKVCD